MPLQTTELLQPIAAAKPGGDDIRSDPVFEQLRTARIEEHDLPTGDWSRERKTADYALVIKLGTEILSKRSKDLIIAAWLTEALLKREGFPGLKSGLELLSALLMQLWDHLYPVVEDDDLEPRRAAIDWVGNKLEPPVRLIPVDHAGHTIQHFRESRSVGYEKDAQTSQQHEDRQTAIASGRLTAEEFDDAFAATPKAFYKKLVAEMDATLAALDGLEKAAQDRFGSGRDGAQLDPLRKGILDVRQITGQLLAKKLELDPDPVVVEDTPSIYAEPGSASAAAAPVSIVPKTRSDAEIQIAVAARFLRSQNAADPAPYLLLRGFRWGELRGGSGEVDPKLLAAPPTEMRAKLRGLLLDRRWPELLEAGEEVMATPFGRGWLDLQRYVLTACAGLGGDYEQVGRTIQGALLTLLRAVPHLPTLVLMDDTPTANAETLAWLRDLNLMGGDESSPAMPATRTPTLDGRGSGHGVYLRAMEKVRSGEPEQGIELLINQALQERSARDRFLRRAEAAQIMVDIGRDAIALPILEDLLRDIDKHALEGWEAGETVALPMGLLFRCMRRSTGDTPETQGLYLRICRLDPMQAMEISGTAAS